jgi:hypothetical protein
MALKKNCKVCQNSFRIDDVDLEFLKKISPVIESRQLSIPPPTHCPDCRRRRRMAFKNERNLYHRSCDLTGKKIISVYSPDKKYPVYDKEVWWGDSWDVREYGVEFDYSRSFFDQFNDLQKRVPRQGLSILNCENCEFNNNLHNSKNCYLVFGSADCEDCCFVSGSISLRDCLEIWWSNDCELCYQIFCGGNLYNCKYCENCKNCNDLYFCNFCLNCSDCFGCYGLNYKSNCVFNEQYSKGDYQEFLQAVEFGSHHEIEQLIKRAYKFFLTQPRKAVISEFSENCTGDMIIESRNCQNCFTIAACQDSSYLFECARDVDSYDLSFSYDITGQVYESIGGVYLFNVLFSNNAVQCSDSYYLQDCYNCKNCFGCTGVRNGEYCILNKEYTQKEYNMLLPKILKHLQQTEEWGEYFPIGLSPFGYNESEAYQYFPVKKDKSLELGANWSEFRRPDPKADRVLPAAELPDSIGDVDEAILRSAISCAETGQLYRLASPELDFYRKHIIPLPRKHPEQRYKEILALRNPARLWQRRCQCSNSDHGHTGRCRISFKTTYSPERPEIIFCRECYRASSAMGKVPGGR